MIIKIVEGKSFGEIVEFLEAELPENIRQDEIEEIARMVFGSRGNDILVGDNIVVRVVL